jgi:hypothetical protein
MRETQMASSKICLKETTKVDDTVGLAAAGSAGGWEVSIDQTTPPNIERWYV